MKCNLCNTELIETFYRDGDKWLQFIDSRLEQKNTLRRLFYCPNCGLVYAKSWEQCKEYYEELKGE